MKKHKDNFDTIINQPRYTGWDNHYDGYRSIKERWQNNEIPFVGYLLMRAGGRRYIEVVWMLIERWVGIRRMVFGDEFSNFLRLIRAKHPEFSNSVFNTRAFDVYMAAGAYAVKEGGERYIQMLIHPDDGLFLGKPRQRGRSWQWESTTPNLDKKFLALFISTLKEIQNEKHDN